MYLFFSLFAFVAIVAYLVYFFIHTNKQLVAHFGALAREYHLQIDTSAKVGFTRHPRVWGQVGDFQIVIASEVRRGGEAYTRWTLTVPDRVRFPFGIYSLSYMGRVDLRQHLHFADKLLDTRTIFVARDEVIAKNFISSREDQLKKIFDKNLFLHLRVDGNMIEFAERRLIHTEKKLEHAREVVQFVLGLGRDLG